MSTCPHTAFSSLMHTLIHFLSSSLSLSCSFTVFYSLFLCISVSCLFLSQTVLRQRSLCVEKDNAAACFLRLVGFLSPRLSSFHSTSCSSPHLIDHCVPTAVIRLKTDQCQTHKRMKTYKILSLIGIAAWRKSQCVF